MNKISIMLLSESREMFGVVLIPLDKWRQLQAAISSLEAAPERKCKNCKHWSEREEECWNPSGLVKTCGGEFGCIKWQPRSDHE